ncbi:MULTISPECIES: hypothetical protein [Flavobacterium]|uniref:hypothetical protein n=1 Tax=Flavobacterium TaxID=237 RepID=UPI001FCCAAA0|nr:MULTISPECIES: hypothetical protein [Flavobacterium]UOK42151.1 hypothetical protein LZF87_12635 [Flavobacterium enshiense]
MNSNYFLKQNAKKVIFLILIIPIIIQLFLINIIQVIHNGSEIIYYLSFLLFGLLYLPYLYWLYSIVNFFFTNSNKFVELKLNNFKICLAINVLVVFNFVLFVAYIFSFVFLKSGLPNTDIILCFGFMQFVGVVSFVYTGYFVSKLITTIELNRKIYFSDIVGNFIILSIPPLAIWIIHNKAKKLAERKN